MPEANATAPGAAPPPAKRRKLRKGTASCWECKRRKTRCTYAAPTAAACDGCRSRQTPCTSQAFDDPRTMPAAEARTAAVRLGRVESLVEQLARRRRSVDEAPPRAEPATAAAATAGDEGPDDAATAVARPARLPGPATDDLADVSRALLAAWPDEHDMALILRVPTSLAILLHGLVCAPYARVLASVSAAQDDDDDEASWPRRLLLPRPSPGTHPVPIARRLLLLATLLRGVPDDVAEARLGGGRLHVPHRTHVARAVDAATRLVTADEALAGGSLDGLECVLLEAMYRNNEGRLRRAWLANRRALALAQLLRLHDASSSSSSPAPPVLEPGTRDRVDPAYLWFRIVCSDRYLSLMLGLPPGTRADADDDAVFAAPAALAACAPLERLERVCTAACGLVLARNHGAARATSTTTATAAAGLAATRRVDGMLRDATALLPPAWWSETVDADALAAGPDARRAFDESARVMAHLALRHVLVQLHLPYLLLPAAAAAAGGPYDYSKMVAANACRAIVAQFVAFRALVPGTAYCRGVDFVAFIASAVLCLAHVEARRQQDDDADAAADEQRFGAMTAFQSLAHQRPGDRALLDRVLAFLDATAQTRDAIAERACRILRPLLAIEDRAARGARYRTSAPGEPGGGAPEDPAGADAEPTPDRLRIDIPYFGTVKVDRESNAAAARPDWQAPMPPYPPAADPPARLLEDWDPAVFGALGDHVQAAFPGLPTVDDDESAWALQGVDTALFTNLSYGWGSG